MILDIFSSFDPNITWFGASHPHLFWVAIILPLTLIAPNFWLNPSFSNLMISYPLEIIDSQTSRTFGSNLKGFAAITSALFILIIIINLMGLIPYTFRFSRHLLITLSLGLPIWLALIISGASHAPASWAAGLLPGGAPDILNPFLVLIETVRISVRPITLSFRLAANITAGHIILGLVGSYARARIFTPGITLSLLVLIQTFYIIFEVGICLIQAYIFCLLLTLYSDEHPPY